METTQEPRWSSYPELPGEPTELPSLSWYETIVRFDGEDILSLWMTDSGTEFWLCLQCEESGEEPWGERLLYYRVSRDQVRAFEDGEVTNRALLLASDRVLLVEKTWRPQAVIAHQVQPGQYDNYLSHESSFHPNARKKAA